MKLRSGLAERTAETITVMISNTSDAPIVIDAGVPIGIVQNVEWKEEPFHGARIEERTRIQRRQKESSCESIQRIFCQKNKYPPSESSDQSGSCRQRSDRRREWCMEVKSVASKKTRRNVAH